MYPPSHFRKDDPDELAAFIQANGFGLLIATGPGGIAATHLPFLLRQGADGIALTCHVAASNPLASIVDGREVKAIFNGPHAYISSRWYDHLNVPTWNYVAVHATGVAALVQDPQEKFSDICALVEHYESDPDHVARMRQLPERFRQSHLDALVGICIQVSHLEGIWKLSQNRHEKDHENIIRQLELSEAPMDHELAREMRKAGRTGQPPTSPSL